MAAINMNVTPPDISGGVLTLVPSSPSSYTFTSTVPVTNYQYTGNLSNASFFADTLNILGTPPKGVYNISVDGIQANATISYAIIASNGSTYMGFPQGNLLSLNGDIYYTNVNNDQIVRLPGGSQPAEIFAGNGGITIIDGTGLAAGIPTPIGIVFNPITNRFYFNSSNAIREMTLGAAVTTIAGTSSAGYVEGTGSVARFNRPRVCDIDLSGNILIADRNNNRIRRYSVFTSTTSLIAGGAQGYVDSTVASNARFNRPQGIAVNRLTGDMYISDGGNNCIRKITPAGVVTTFAGSSNPGNVDGVGSNARFNNPETIVWRPQDNCLYVTDTFYNRVKKITMAGVVTTFAGNGTSTSPLVNGVNQTIPFEVQGLGVDSSSGNLLFAAAGRTAGGVLVEGGVGTITFPGPEVRPSQTRPTDFTIVSTTNPVTVNVPSQIVTITATPPIVDGVATLYKYSPFEYTFSNATTPSSFTVTAPTELSSYVTISGSIASFSSTTGFPVSYSSVFPISFNALFGSNVTETFAFNVQVLPGRFFPPVAGASNTFYLNEAITPILFQSDISVTQIYSSPSLPPGLSFVQLDASGSQYQLQGTPTVQSVPTVYNIVGRNTQTGRIVSVINTYRVDPERVVLSLTPPSSNISNMIVGTAITGRNITAVYPTYGTYSFQYRWIQVLPPGLQLLDAGANPVVSGFSPSDLSSTIQLAGTPTLEAAQLFRTSNITSYPFTLTANLTRGTSSINTTIPFTFSFGPTVLFTQEPSNVTLYINDVIDPSDGFVFKAGTFFTSGTVNISSIFSPNLRSDLSLQFVPGSPESTAYLVSATGATFAETNQPYIVQAIDSNGLVRNTVVFITTQPDVVTFTPPTDLCSTFIFSRSLSSSKTGYYNSPINFRATATSGRTITYDDGGTLAGTGLSLSNVASNNSVRLVGTPITTQSLTNLTITATADQTFATGNTTVQFSIVPDSATWTVVPTLPNPLEIIQNVEMTPYQFRATTLSDLPIAYYSSTNAPLGTNISSSGRLAGTPTLPGPGTMTVVGDTGYSALTLSVPYDVLPDEILFVTPSNLYPITPGQSIPNIPITAFSYSGIFGSNFTLDPSGNPTYGVAVTSSGTIYGTAVQQVPPTLLYPDPPIPLYVSAIAGTVSGTFAFLLGTNNPGLNPNPYLYFSNQTGPAFPPQDSEYTLYQYGNTSITVLPPPYPVGQFPYLYIHPSDLPAGLQFNGLTGVISGYPTELTFERAVTVHALQRATKLVSSFTMYITVLNPFIVRPQTSAAAYTALLRQYTLANSTQNSRDTRVFAGAESNQGAFGAGEGTDVTTQIIPGCDPNCPPVVIPTVPFSPLEIDGCALWLDAFDSAIVSGGNVTKWNDKSGQGNHATQIAGTPVYDVSAINGHPAVTLDICASLYGSLSNTGVYASAFAVFNSALSLLLDSSLGYHPVLSTGRADGTGDVTLLANDGVPSIQGSLSFLTERLGTVTLMEPANFEPSIIQSFYDGTSSYIADTGEIGNTSNISTGNFNYVRYGLGNNAGTPTLITLPWVGSLGEILVYHNVLAVPDREKVEGYLAWKWGLEDKLPSNHPYKNAPPIGTPIKRYSIAQSTTTVDEGGSVTFTVTTTDVPDGTILYWSTSGTATALDFTDGVTSGSFTILGGTATITRTLKTDFITEGQQTFVMRIRTGSTTGIIVATSDVITVNDNTNYIWTEQTGAPQFIYTKLAVTSSFKTMISSGPNTGGSVTVPRGPYVSRDQGATWARKVNGISFGTTTSWTIDVVVARQNPLIMYCANGGGSATERIYKSIDGGESWTVTTAPIGRWQSIACSGDGSIVLAGRQDNSQFFISRDGGATWSAGPYTGTGWRDCAMSMDGTRMYVVRVGSPNVHCSSDTGFTWSLTSVGVNLRSVDCSADGLTVLVGRSSSTLTLSKNGGVTFTPVSVVPSGITECVCISDDGLRMAAISLGTNRIYLSTDAGITWYPQTGAPSTSWEFIDMNEDGTKIFAGPNPGKPYVGVPP